MPSKTLLDEETDAELNDNCETTWIGVKGFSVYIKKTDNGVAVGIYARDAEDCEALAECYAFDNDAEFMRDENAH